MVKTFFTILTLLLLLGCESTKPKYGYIEPKDTTPPTITLNGKKDIVLALGENYIEKGAKAVDDFDGDISNSVDINGTVNTNEVGLYTIYYSVKDSAGNKSKILSRTIRVTTFATAQLGNLADADIYIYKIEENGTKKLLFQEKSASAYNLDDIGKFDTHADALKANELYLFKIVGGKDWDSNDNGIKDSYYTSNSGTIRAYVTGQELIEANNKFRVTLISEILTELVAKDIKYSYNKDNFKTKLYQNANKLVKQDIDGSGSIDNIDILIFNPITDQPLLTEKYRANFSKLTDLIHQNRLPVNNIDSTIANLSTLHFARYIKLSKDKTKAYIADGNAGLFVADISDNSKPKFTLNVKTPDFARAIELDSSENYAYIADSDKGLQVVDLNSKSIVASLDLNATTRALTLGKDNKLYIAASSGGVKVVDISNPTAPKLDYNITTPDIAYSVTLSKDKSKLFIADNKAGLIVYNLDTNTTLGSFNTYGYSRGVALSSDESKAFVADGTKGLYILDISNLSNSSKIKFISRKDTPDFARSVVLNSKQTKAYVADTKGNIQVIDISDVTNPKIINSISTPYRSYHIALSQNEEIAYVATGINGLEIVDLNGFKNPAILSTLNSKYKAYKVYKSGNTIYIPQGYKGLQIVNTNDKFAPVEITSFDSPGFGVDLAIDNNIIYLADGYKGLQKVDITNPNNPTIIANYPTNNFIGSVRLIPNSNNLILSDGDGGIKILDKTDLSLVGSFSTNSKAGDITLDVNSTIRYI